MAVLRTAEVDAVAADYDEVIGGCHDSDGGGMFYQPV